MKSKLFSICRTLFHAGYCSELARITLGFIYIGLGFDTALIALLALS